MKNYEQPALELIKFSIMDVICASTDFTPDAPTTAGGSSSAEEEYHI